MTPARAGRAGNAGRVGVVASGATTPGASRPRRSASPWTPSSSLPGQLGTLISYENEAVRITQISDIVPGLLQSADYARAMVAATPGPYPMADLVLARMGRQALLRSRNAPVYTAYLDEVAFRRVVGGPAVMADQLDLLIDHAHATVRVIPEAIGPQPGWMIGGRGMGTILEFADADPVVYLEHLATGTYLDRRSDTSVYLEALATLSAVAMTPDDSAKVIASYRDQYERQAP